MRSDEALTDAAGSAWLFRRCEPCDSQALATLVVFDLDPTGEVIAASHSVLSADEQARAARFVLERDRRRFIIARARLRLLLGAYTGEPPQNLRFEYGAQGKPALADVHPPVQFNLSHAAHLGLVGISHAGAIGVDIEERRPLEDQQQIAQQMFSAREVADYLALPDAARTDGFFNCWTRKEAFIKAAGQGLSLSLQCFDVSLTPGAPARMLRIECGAAIGQRWLLGSFEPVPGFVAAAVVCYATGGDCDCEITRDSRQLFSPTDSPGSVG